VPLWIEEGIILVLLSSDQTGTLVYSPTACHNLPEVSLTFGLGHLGILIGPISVFLRM